MRVGVDATFRLHGGGALHLQRLLQSWCEDGFYQRHSVVVFARVDSAALVRCWTGGHVEIQCFGTVLAPSLRLFWQQSILPLICRSLGLDVLLCPGNTAPLWGIKTVVVFQNAAPFCTNVRLSTEGARRWISFRLLRALMTASARTAGRCIFISNWFAESFTAAIRRTTAHSILYLGRETESDDSTTAGAALHQSFQRPLAVCVSHIYPYKNLSALIEGFQSERGKLVGLGLNIVIAGKPMVQREWRKLVRLIEAYDLSRHIHLIGEVAPEVVPTLMRSADFVVFQSTCENCPSTLIEAISLGAPIACSNAGVMPEIAGDAALFYDPFDPASIGSALVQMTVDSNLRERLRRLAVQRSVAFPTWTEVAVQMEAALYSASSADHKS